jgi:hypothetical protein
VQDRVRGVDFVYFLLRVKFNISWQCLHNLDWVVLFILEGRQSVTQLLVEWDYLAFGFILIEEGGCIDNFELELIVCAVHVSVC